MKIAMQKGNWQIVQQIIRAKMSSKMKEKAKIEEDKIKSQYGLIESFLNERLNMISKDDDKDMIIVIIVIITVQLRKMF